jgi:hypothetical protein
MTLKYVTIGTMISKMIMIMAIMTILGSSGMAYGSALSRSDIDRNPEGVCIMYGDEPGMKPVCDWINVCDDNGRINSTHQFCTGEAVRNIPHPPGGCPEGYYSEEDDESGLCYSIEEGCRSENLIMNREETNCSSIVEQCQKDPFLDRCKVTRNLGIPNNLDEQNCERSVPDFCFEPYVESWEAPNGTRIQGTDLDCRDVNATDFRVTMADRHNFDQDYDGMGCETINK